MAVSVSLPGQRQGDDVLAVGRKDACRGTGSDLGRRGRHRRHRRVTGTEPDRVVLETAHGQQRRVLVHKVRGQQHGQPQQHHRIHAAAAGRQRLSAKRIFSPKTQKKSKEKPTVVYSYCPR